MRCFGFVLRSQAAVCIVVLLAGLQIGRAGDYSSPLTSLLDKLFKCDWELPPAHVYVLAVGIARYPSHRSWDSESSVNDAEDLGAIFRSPQFSSLATVIVLPNDKATKVAIRAAVQEMAQSAGPQDMFVFSFSGHEGTAPGKKGKQEVYLAPADAEARVPCESIDCVDDQMISGSLLYSWMTQIRSRRQILLLDTSHTDRAIPVFDRYWRKEGCSVGPYAMKRILMVTNHGEALAREVGGRYQGRLSIITENALRGITQDGTGQRQSDSVQIPLITAADLQQSIYRQAGRLARFQSPVRAELLGGDFVVSGPPGRAAKPTELVLDSNLGPVCYEDMETPSRGVYAVGSGSNETPPAEPAAPKNYALVIATDNYKNWPTLSNPVFDATTIEADLKKTYGFQVEHLFDPSRQELKAKLDELHQRHFGSEDQLFIFIAGHGDYDASNDIGYLVFKDAPKGHDYDSDMNLMELRSRVDTIPAKHIFLVMDSCFAGSLDPQIGGAGNRSEYDPIPLEVLIRRSADKTTRIFLTSGNKEYVPDGQPGHHSPFAALFIQALEKKGGQDGYLSLAKLPPYFQRLTTTARMGSLGHNETGSEFFFVQQEEGH